MATITLQASSSKDKSKIYISIDDLLFHIDYTKDDRCITMAATRAILADKMTTEIDNKIFELSELIDKNADCLNSKSDQFQ